MVFSCGRFLSWMLWGEGGWGVLDNSLCSVLKLCNFIVSLKKIFKKVLSFLNFVFFLFFFFLFLFKLKFLCNFIFINIFCIFAFHISEINNPNRKKLLSPKLLIARIVSIISPYSEVFLEWPVAMSLLVVLSIKLV